MCRKRERERECVEKGREKRVCRKRERERECVEKGREKESV